MCQKKKLSRSYRPASVDCVMEHPHNAAHPANTNEYTTDSALVNSESWNTSNAIPNRARISLQDRVNVTYTYCTLDKQTRPRSGSRRKLRMPRVRSYYTCLCGTHPSGKSTLLSKDCNTREGPNEQVTTLQCAGQVLRTLRFPSQTMALELLTCFLEKGIGMKERSMRDSATYEIKLLSIGTSGLVANTFVDGRVYELNSMCRETRLAQKHSGLKPTCITTEARGFSRR